MLDKMLVKFLSQGLNILFILYCEISCKANVKQISIKANGIAVFLYTIILSCMFDNIRKNNFIPDKMSYGMLNIILNTIIINLINWTKCDFHY
jgi:hypothetical protein